MYIGGVVSLRETNGDVRQRLLLGQFSQLDTQDLDGLEAAVERLLADAGLAGHCDLDDEGGVGRVRGDDDDAVDERIGQNLLNRGSDLGLLRQGGKTISLWPRRPKRDVVQTHSVRVRLAEGDRRSLERVVDGVHARGTSNLEDVVGVNTCEAWMC